MGILYFTTTTMTMNKSEALAIDNRSKMLPGGQGEHEFWIPSFQKSTEGDLENFAEHCGGLYQCGNPGVLHTCDCGVFLIHFAADSSRVTKIERLFAPTRLVLYWDERRERITDDYYQCGNRSAPFLSDWELTDHELAVDQARIDRELAETPPPKPKPIDHDKIFRDELGLTADQERDPSLTFELLAYTDVPGTHDLLESDIMNLGRMERAKQKYPGRATYILLRKPIKPEADGLQAGDIIVRKLKGYRHNDRGVVTVYGGELTVCYNASPLWNPLHAKHGHRAPSCSGGPFDRPVIENCKLIGTDLQHYWYWRDGWAGGGCGVSYNCIVNVWHWVD